MFSRSIKAYFLIISLFLSVIISSNVYANTSLTLSSNSATISAGGGDVFSWRASNGDAYRVITKPHPTFGACPSWITLTSDDSIQSTGLIKIAPPIGTKSNAYYCAIEACSTVYSNSCDTENIAITIKEKFVKFDLNVSVSKGGIVTSSPTGINCGTICRKDYTKDTNVTLTATPDDGYVFDSWSKDCVGKEYLCNVTMINNKNVVANFKARPTYKKHTLKFNVSGKGTFNIIALATSVTPENCKSTCTIQNAGSNSAPLTIIAKPDSGYKFSNWVGIPECSTNSTCSMTVSKNMTIGVKFVPIEIVTKKFNLNISVKGKGRVVINANSRSINCSADCPLSLEKGTSVKLTAKADNGYLFKSWSGGCTGNPCTLSMSENKTISATFEKKVVTIETFKLSVSVKGQGTVTSSPSGINCTSDCSKDYKKGTTIKLTASPKAGYILNSWDGACAGLSCEIKNIESNKSVTVSFKSATNQPRITSISPLKVKFDRWADFEIKGVNLTTKILATIGKESVLLENNKGLYKFRYRPESLENITIEFHDENGNKIKNEFSQINVVNKAQLSKTIDALVLISKNAGPKQIKVIKSSLKEASEIFLDNNINGHVVKFNILNSFNGDSYEKTAIQKNINIKGVNTNTIEDHSFLKIMTDDNVLNNLRIKNKSDLIIYISDKPFFPKGTENKKAAGFTFGVNSYNDLIKKRHIIIISIYGETSTNENGIRIIHEIGHVLGLSHVMEKEEDRFNLDDFTTSEQATSIDKSHGTCIKDDDPTSDNWFKNIASIMYNPEECGILSTGEWNRNFSYGSKELIKITTPDLANKFEFEK